jgi:hypothetical protein
MSHDLDLYGPACNVSASEIPFEHVAKVDDERSWQRLHILPAAVEVHLQPQMQVTKPLLL